MNGTHRGRALAVRHDRRGRNDKSETPMTEWVVVLRRVPVIAVRYQSRAHPKNCPTADSAMSSRERDRTRESRVEFRITNSDLTIS